MVCLENTSVYNMFHHFVPPIWLKNQNFFGNLYQKALRFIFKEENKVIITVYNLSRLKKIIVNGRKTNQTADWGVNCKMDS